MSIQGTILHQRILRINPIQHWLPGFLHSRNNVGQVVRRNRRVKDFYAGIVTQELFMGWMGLASHSPIIGYLLHITNILQINSNLYSMMLIEIIAQLPTILGTGTLLLSCPKNRCSEVEQIPSIAAAEEHPYRLHMKRGDGEPVELPFKVQNARDIMGVMVLQSMPRFQLVDAYLSVVSPDPV